MAAYTGYGRGYVGRGLPQPGHYGMRRPGVTSRPWTGGLALVALGGLLLLSNLGLAPLAGNWWAAFILLLAAASATSAARLFRQAGNRLTPQVSRSLTVTVLLVLVTATSLFQLSWGRLWPLFLIIAGLGALLDWQSDGR